MFQSREFKQGTQREKSIMYNHGLPPISYAHQSLESAWHHSLHACKQDIRAIVITKLMCIMIFWMSRVYYVTRPRMILLFDFCFVFPKASSTFHKKALYKTPERVANKTANKAWSLDDFRMKTGLLWEIVAVFKSHCKVFGVTATLELSCIV